jgi:hypothetical protein
MVELKSVRWRETPHHFRFLQWMALRVLADRRGSPFTASTNILNALIQGDTG